MYDDTPMCERHEANYIQSEGYQNQNSLDSYSHQSHHDRNDFEKSLTELNNDVRNDLKDFKRCIHSMRTPHWKLFASDDGKTTPAKMKIDFNFQTIFKNMERKIDEWEKSQNISLEQIERTGPPLPQAHTEHVNVVFTRSGKSTDPPKIQTLPPIIVKDKPIKTSKGNYHVVKTNEYSFREYIPKTPYPQCLNVDHSHLNRIIKES
ncbi:hypothetical protein Tco_1534162 [Tanacetum coccineum]